MCAAAVTLILSTRLAIPTHPTYGEQLSRHLRLYAILRFRKPIALPLDATASETQRAGEVGSSMRGLEVSISTKSDRAAYELAVRLPRGGTLCSYNSSSRQPR